MKSPKIDSISAEDTQKMARVRLETAKLSWGQEAETKWKKTIPS